MRSKASAKTSGAPEAAFKGDTKAMASLTRCYGFYCGILNLVIKFKYTSIEFTCISGAHTYGGGGRVRGRNFLPKKILCALLVCILG